MIKKILKQKESCLFLLDNKDKKQKGSILIAVLWSLFFLSALALAIHSYIGTQLDLASNLRDRVKMRYLAQSAVQRAILELRNDEVLEYDTLNELWSHNEKEFKDIVVSLDGSFSLKYVRDMGEGVEETFYGMVDEERKININQVSSQVLKQLFEVIAEVPSPEAGDIADAIIDWRDEDDELSEYGAENGYYQTLNPPYSCKNKNFEVLEELFLVKGMTQEIFDKVKSFITIFGDGGVNINTADTLVFQSLGLTLSLAEKIRRYRSGSDLMEGTEDDQAFSSADNIAAVLESSEGLSAEETELLNKSLEAGFLNVKSNYFMGYVTSQLIDEAKSQQIVFVINRNEQIQFWRE